MTTVMSSRIMYPLLLIRRTNKTAYRPCETGHNGTSDVPLLFPPGSQVRSETMRYKPSLDLCPLHISSQYRSGEQMSYSLCGVIQAASGILRMPLLVRSGFPAQPEMTNAFCLASRLRLDLISLSVVRPGMTDLSFLRGETSSPTAATIASGEALGVDSPGKD